MCGGRCSGADKLDKDNKMDVEICYETGGAIQVDRDKLMEEHSICSDETEEVNCMDGDGQIKETLAKDTDLEEDCSVEEHSVEVKCMFEETAAEAACNDENDLFMATSAMVSSKDEYSFIGKMSTRANCEDRNDLVEAVQEKEEHSVLLKVIKPIFDEENWQDMQTHGGIVGVPDGLGKDIQDIEPDGFQSAQG